MDTAGNGSVKVTESQIMVHIGRWNHTVYCIYISPLVNDCTCKVFSRLPNNYIIGWRYLYMSKRCMRHINKYYNFAFKKKLYIYIYIYNQHIISSIYNMDTQSLNPNVLALPGAVQINWSAGAMLWAVSSFSALLDDERCRRLWWRRVATLMDEYRKIYTWRYVRPLGPQDTSEAGPFLNGVIPPNSGTNILTTSHITTF